MHAICLIDARCFLRWSLGRNRKSLLHRDSKVIAGAPYEFGTMEDQEALGNRCGRYALHRLAD